MEIPRSPSGYYWWLGINNNLKRRTKDQVVVYGEIESFLNGILKQFSWPCRGQTHSCYKDMEIGDKAILWMGHGEEEAWGVLGIVQVEDMRLVRGEPQECVLSRILMPDQMRILIPYMKGRPGKTENTEFLRKVFQRREFAPLLDIFHAAGYIEEKRRMITVERVFPDEFAEIFKRLSM